MDLENRDQYFLPPEDYLKSGENTGALLFPGEKPGCGGFCSRVCSSQRWGRAHCCPPKSQRVLCLLYWYCWLGERELGPGLGGSELALGARSA